VSRIYHILADPALARSCAHARPPRFDRSADIDKQVELISDRLDLETFADPDELTKLLNRFAALWDVNSDRSDSTGATQLFGNSGQIGISMDLMMQISQLRR
jgi:hypothetical protein